MYDDQRTWNVLQPTFQSVEFPEFSIRANIEEDYPEYVYKYLPKKYGTKLLNRGKLKLGTLFEYRSIEDGARADSNEGTHTFTTCSIEGVPTVVELASVNCWIFCTSEMKSRFLQSKFGGYAVQIRTFSFFKDLAISLAPECDVCSLRKVQYLEDSDLDFMDSGEINMPWVRIIKGKNFAVEHEWRMTFESRIAKKTPFKWINTSDQRSGGPKLGVKYFDVFDNLGPKHHEYRPLKEHCKPVKC